MDRLRAKLTKRRIRFKTMLLSIFSLFLFFIGFFLLYREDQQRIDSSKIKYSLSSLMTMLAGKQYLHHNVKKESPFIRNKNEEEPVHFEFYTSLPTMQVAVPREKEK